MRGSGLVRTWTGFAITRLLARHWPNLVDETFTCRVGNHGRSITCGEVRDGRFNASVSDEKTNATLPEGIEADEITLEQPLALIAARPPKRTKSRRPQKA